MRRQCTTPTPKKNTYCPVVLSEQYAETDTVVIPLPSGDICLIDGIDFATVSKFRWHAQRRVNAIYAVSYVGRKRISMHRIILPNVPDGLEIDHKNRNGLDNRRSNLRAVTHSQNVTNTPPLSGKYRGVSWHRSKKKWRAGIEKGGKSYWLGYFESPEKAAQAYDAAAVVLHGDCAYLNFPDGRNDTAE